MFVTAPFFDTHKTVKELQKSGFTEEQAEGHVKILSEIIKDNLATKSDLQKMENELKIEMKKMENSLQKEIYKTRTETIKWVAGMLLAQVIAQMAGFIALIKLIK